MLDMKSRPRSGSEFRIWLVMTVSMVVFSVSTSGGGRRDDDVFFGEPLGGQREVHREHGADVDFNVLLGLLSELVKLDRDGVLGRRKSGKPEISVGVRDGRTFGQGGHGGDNGARKGFLGVVGDISGRCSLPF